MLSNRLKRWLKVKGETPDPTPIAKPIGWAQPPSLRETVLQAIRYHAEEARRSGAETFDEADDFDWPDSDGGFGPGHQLPDDVLTLERWNEGAQRSGALAHAEEQIAKHRPPQGQMPAGGPPASAQSPPKTTG